MHSRLLRGGQRQPELLNLRLERLRSAVSSSSSSGHRGSSSGSGSDRLRRRRARLLRRGPGLLRLGARLHQLGLVRRAGRLRVLRRGGARGLQLRPRGVELGGQLRDALLGGGDGLRQEELRPLLRLRLARESLAAARLPLRGGLLRGAQL